MTTNTCKEALTPPAQLPQPPTSCFRRRRKAGGGPAPAALRAERQSPLRRFPGGVTAQSAERQPMQTDRTVNKGKKKQGREQKPDSLNVFWCAVILLPVLGEICKFYRVPMGLLLNFRAKSPHCTQENAVCFVSLHINYLIQKNYLWSILLDVIQPTQCIWHVWEVPSDNISEAF